MEFRKKHIPLIGLFFLGMFVFLLPLTIKAQPCDCSDTADPPFLARGSTPNLLLMVDNSASMYDIAYTKSDGTVCYDDSYNGGVSYSGYFEGASWYAYSTANSRFEPAAGGVCAGAAGATAYANSDVCVVTKTALVGGVNTTIVDSFKAKGNFLNWATASKFDIEKQILTGGKYDGTELESEGRGCSGNSFIKQVGVTSAGKSYKLVLGVRSDYDKTDNIDTTLIDIFDITATGFSPTRCQEAIALMRDPTGLGQVKQAVTDCMNYVGAAPGEHDKQALVESLHDCWYLQKQGGWPGGGAQGFNFEKWCKEAYDRGDDPRAIMIDDAAYVCAGDSTDLKPKGGFIGECWTPPGQCSDRLCGAGPPLAFNERCKNGKVERCTNWNTGKKVCKNESDWVVVKDCVGGGATGSWKTPAELMLIDPAWTTLDKCITAARERFCGYIKVPQVVDPSDLQMSTGETWNLPAMLMSQGASGQLGDPIATLKGRLQLETAPSGLLQLYADKMRIGAMAFNYDGTKSECSKPLPYVTYDCGDPDNKDGTYLVQPIGRGAANTASLISNINKIKANAWTPLAEAVYNAIGYYTQRADLRLNATDFPVNSPPVTAWCEKNNLLIITDGASTADQNGSVLSKGSEAGDGDADKNCGDLFGSTSLDDLTHYAWKGNIFSGSPYASAELYNKISTFFVVAGTPRDTGGNDECNPKILLNNAAANGGTTAPYIATTPAELKKKIEEALRDILKRAAAGSAASVIAATRGGEGAVYQAIFWPQLDDPAGNPTVSWGGEVHALLVDAHGRLYSDEDGDKALSAADNRVVFFYDLANNATMACYGEVNAAGVCSGPVKNLHEVKYLWSAAEWLAGVSDADIESNRATYISNQKKRYIFTWNDLNNNGSVEAGAGLDSNEVLSFVPGKNWSALPVSVGTRPAVPYDFNVSTNVAVDAIVSWVRGKDTPADRKRLVPKPANFAAGLPATITWRLGDIIHSTPTAVGRPAEGFNIPYRDTSYGEFLDKYQHRRNVIYFGGNDGLLHAINGGFYSESRKGFCRSAGCVDNPASPELGAELWAYAPYNLLPHLHCLKKTDYLHKYYMDLKPRIFDVQIFTPDADHPQGWGTILVAGMRQGGGRVDTGQSPDTRKFASSYVVMDITNPEKPPVLLGELTFDPATSMDLAHTVSIPAVVPMKKGAATKWYLVVGSGPTDINSTGFSTWGSDGTSNQKPRVGVFPLDTLTTGSKLFRIPSAAPNAGSPAGSYVLTDSGNGMVSDIISVDYDLFKDYRADALYFGTIEGDYASNGDTWRGKLYRWVTNADDDMTSPEKWGKSKVELGPPGVMFDPARPVTAAPSVGYDGFNFWIYFGTGRFMHKDDKTDISSNAQETYYGIKEPLDCDGNFTWAKVANTDAMMPPAPFDVPGTRKLLRVDQILVQQADKAQEALLSCQGGGSGCLPTGVTHFADLVEYIAGEGCMYDDNKAPKGYSGTDGWYLRFPAERERNLGQATLLGGLLTFTTYQPFDDVCRPEGEAFLYGAFYQTGTAWYKSVFNEDIGLKNGNVVSRVGIGRGLATTPNLHVGRQEGTKAFAQTSTGAIVEINQPNLPIKTHKSGRMNWRSE